MTNESLERALAASLNLMLVLATLDLVLYIWVGTAVLTVIAHTMSLWLLLRHRLVFAYDIFIFAVCLLYTSPRPRDSA